MTSTRPRTRPALLHPAGSVTALAVLLGLLTACGGADADMAAAMDNPAVEGPAAEDPGVDGPAVDDAAVDVTTDATKTPESTEPDQGADRADRPDAETPEESFRTWLAASREPDPDLACTYLSDALVRRMVAEMTADGWTGVTDCHSMTTTTAELYRAFQSSADVALSLVEETADHAVLAVQYASGDCGTAVMVPVAGRWVMDDRTEEQC